MQPSNPLQPRGSFSKPQNLAKAIEQAEAEMKSPAAAEAKDEPVKLEEKPSGELTEAQKKEAEEKERLARVAQVRKDIQTDLECSITDEDVKHYLFKGSISKELSIVPKLMKGTFKTLKIEDLQKVDSRMAKIRDQAGFTNQGLANEESIIALSYSWTHADGKPLGDTAEAREEKIRKMGALFVQAASTVRIRFDTLIQIAMNEGGILKK